MLPKIQDYEQFIGRTGLNQILDLATKLNDKHIVHINSTYAGGGVAEILNSLILLMNQAGVDTDWRLLKGSHSFFDVTKKFHNGLQGEDVRLSPNEKRIYLDELEKNAIMQHFREHDLVFIHDPQPLALIKYVKKKRQPWIWRCHIEVGNKPNEVWKFLHPFANKYDGVIFSLQQYRKDDLDMEQFFVAPSIDPLSIKNKDLPSKQSRKMIANEGISLKRPIITQISRFDKWKNPLGVLRIFKKVQARTNAQLVLMGDMAADDPEGPKIYSRIAKQAEKMKDVFMITKKDDLLVNALQRESHVVMQNSIREGFGLTVTEAMWKGTPVIGTPTGGIPMQIIHGRTGALIRSEREAVDWCLKLINDQKLREQMGIDARDHVRKNFLITRHLYDYLNIINHYTATVADDMLMVAKNLRRLLIPGSSKYNYNFFKFPKFPTSRASR